MDKIRFAIIGTSKITEEFLDAAKNHDKFELTCIYSRRIEKAKDFSKKHGGKFLFDNLDKMANSDEFDAVYIASPNALHYSQAIKFLKAKKHVLCEKAFALNVAEAKEMIQTAIANKVLLMEAMRSTSAKGFLALKNNLHKIGEIRRYFASFCQYSSRYDLYKSGEEVPNIFKVEMGAGALMDIGVYCIAPMINLFGFPNDVLATADFLENAADGQGTAICTYDEFDGVIMYSKIANSTLGIEIQGEEGTIVSDNIRFTNVEFISRDGSKEIIFNDDIQNDMFYEIDDFISTILKGNLESEINTLENTIVTVKLLDKIRDRIGLRFK